MDPAEPAAEPAPEAADLLSNLQEEGAKAGEKVSGLFSQAMDMASSAAPALSLEKETPTADDDDGAEAPSPAPAASGFMDMFSAPAMGAAVATPHKQQAEAGLHRTLSERRHSAHVMALLDAAEDSAPPKLAQILHKLHPLAEKLLGLVDTLGPPALAYWGKAVAIYKKMPHSVLTALYGLALCFFGGVFANTIAASEVILFSYHFCDLQSKKCRIYPAWCNFTRKLRKS